MAFDENKLSPEIKGEYDKLLQLISLNVEDDTQASELTTTTLNKIGQFENTSDINLAIKTYVQAYEKLSSDSQDMFKKSAHKIPDYFDDMLKRRAAGRFKTSEVTAEKISEDEFLTNAAILMEAFIEKEQFYDAYSKTGLPDNPKVKLAYSLFLEQVDEAFDNLHQTFFGNLEEISEMQNAAMKEFEKTKSNTIIGHIKMAQAMAEASNDTKAILPFAIFLKKADAEDALIELKEELDEYETYLIESTEWGAYNILDHIHADMAKSYMFERAVVPLAPAEKDGNTADSKENKNDENKTEFIPLNNAITFYQQKEDADGINAVIQAAVIPMKNPEGKTTFFSLNSVFSAIDDDPEYRSQIVDGMETPLPVSVADITTQMALDKILVPEKIVSIESEINNTDEDNELVVAENAYRKLLEPIKTILIKNYVKVVSEMNSTEDMQACAEYMVANATTTIQSVMTVPNRLKKLANNYEYYMTTHPVSNQTDEIDGLVKIEIVKPHIEKAISTFEAISNLFVEQTENGKNKKLNPLFANVDEKLSKQLLTTMEKADYQLGQLLPSLEAFAKTQQAKKEIGGYKQAPEHIQEKLREAVNKHSNKQPNP